MCRVKRLHLRGGGTVSSAGGREADGLRCKDAKRQRSEANLKILGYYGTKALRSILRSFHLAPWGRGQNFLANECELRNLGEGSVGGQDDINIFLKRTYSPRKRAAFTLAEVLITLGIIGIVAAMTIPGMIVKHQKQIAAARLKQTYSILSQALVRSQAEYGDMNTWILNVSTAIDPDNENQYYDLTADFLKHLVPYLQLSSEPAYNADLTQFGYQNPYKTKDGTNYRFKKTCLVELANGVSLFVGINGNGTTEYTLPLIYVDINGKLGPNIVGRDLYLFTFDAGKTKKLQPYGYQYTIEELKEKCKKEGENANNTCAALIMKNGWQINEDYPW